MPDASGFIGGLTNVGLFPSSGSMAASVTVSGQAVADYDALLQIQAESFNEFDAQVCVVIGAQLVAPSALIQTPTAVNASGLPNSVVTFAGTGTASGDATIVDYKWFFNNIETSVSGGATTDHVFAESGSFLVTLRVMDSNGFFGFDTLRFNTFSGVALELPGLEISGTPQGGPVSLVVDFTSSGSGVAGSDIHGFSWNFGHGQFSRRQNQNDVTFHVPGDYIPVCTLVDSRNVRVSDSLNIGANN